MVPSMVAVKNYVTHLAMNTGACRIAVQGRELSTALSDLGADHSLISVASQMDSTPGDFYEALTSADMGVSPVDLAVAETGTLIVLTTNESDRLVSALPKTHVAVVDRSSIVYSLDDAASYLAKVFAEKIGGFTVSLITGVSKTSDIGGIVVKGVHGPSQLHVLILDNGSQGGL